MQKLIFILAILLAYNVRAQKNPTYKDVSICKQEGMVNKGDIKMLGEQKYVSILKEFETKLNKTKNNYSDYYRFYVTDGGVKLKGISAYLIPKSIVSDEQKTKKEYRVIGDKRTLWIYYDLKTKKLTKPRSFMLTPDL
ncbi:hypothetical protein [Elizabethkingia anophelis]|uniref:hypothetical protein n=1 Tax=Elizabethkingia anophelis TaxID=1117645 RepID=UPI0024E25CFF|nr:hypothetical protein [Elizabethkingia anophelis]MCT4162127.1 hypothetical protein [Elizabethkingia anophelis]CAH1144064.1 hypothetical protein EAVNVB490_01617 [Elizabethkingia anophelis]CAI9670540.1 hypothetical protein EAVNNN508_01616 [Elizabethkingia anophelis]CAI9673184.1 hypothetical protein EAVNVB490_00546 [Elizabethkingia anophelis]CAI9678066.1 hypothetical protein EAVNNN508_00544 [Elizabethkingia anophelis]